MPARKERAESKKCLSCSPPPFFHHGSQRVAVPSYSTTSTVQYTSVRVKEKNKEDGALPFPPPKKEHPGTPLLSFSLPPSSPLELEEAQRTPARLLFPPSPLLNQPKTAANGKTSLRDTRPPPLLASHRTWEGKKPHRQCGFHPPPFQTHCRMVEWKPIVSKSYNFPLSLSLQK